MSGLGWVGILAEIMSPRLCMSITDILFTKCAMAWVSGTPVCLARRARRALYYCRTLPKTVLKSVL